MANEHAYFVGIDWGSEQHRVCTLNGARELVDERVVEHSGAGLGLLVDWLASLAPEPDQVAVAIEVPRGPVVEMLLERGLAVYAINPKQLDRFRDRHTAAGAKDDRRDAFVLADSLRTDREAFRRAHNDDPLVVQLRELSRLHDELGAESVRVANRLRDQLQRFWPELLRLCPAANEAWFWDLLEPALQKGPRLSAGTVERILRRHRIRRLTAPQVVEALRAPMLRVAAGTVSAVGEHISFLLPQLRLLHEQKARCDRRLDALLDELATVAEAGEHIGKHRDVEIIRSVAGVGTVVAATMLVEASQALRDRDYHALRTHAGTAPVTRQSGKKTTVRMRYACNQRLRQAMYHLARTNIQRDPASRARYDAMRGRGHSHGRALRAVADRVLRVIVAMLKSGSLYRAIEA